MADQDEDIYVQLEAAAALAVHGDAEGWSFIEDKMCSSSLSVALETQLETIIVASEIPDSRSEQLLIETLRDSERHDELRAGAAWALGQFVSERSATVLVDTFNASPVDVRVEAAKALLRIAEPQIPYLLDLLKTCDPAKRDGLAWVLARTGGFVPAEVIAAADDNLRRWASYILGNGRARFSQHDVETIFSVDPEVYFAASVLWQIMASWIDVIEDY
jgi:HEAT repeat protein